MRVLVTGATGVIGEGVIPALLDAGHEIRLLTRGAEDGAKEWPERVEPFKADISKSTTLRGAADAWASEFLRTAQKRGRMTGAEGVT